MIWMMTKQKIEYRGIESMLTKAKFDQRFLRGDACSLLRGHNGFNSPRIQWTNDCDLTLSSKLPEQHNSKVLIDAVK